ncbi:hypothetical protein HDU98_000020 [Podochytrium sp. JEL0797]|nr:hypothetical protein HDU98_000020 [Podochytrium sp. JEL0797]
MHVDRSRIIAGHISGGITMVTQFISKSSLNHVMNHFVGFHNGPVTAMASLPNTPGLIISGGADGCIRIWDVASFRCLRVSNASAYPIKSISFDAKTHIVASCSAGSVFVWDLDMLALSKQMSPNLDEIPVEFDPSRSFHHDQLPIHTLLHDTSSNTVVTAVDAPLPHGILVWRLGDTNEPILRFKSSTRDSSIANVTNVVWDRLNVPPSAKFSVLVSGHADSACLVWHVPESSVVGGAGVAGVTIQPVRKIQVTVSSALSALTLDPFKLIVGTVDGLIKCFDVSTGIVIKSVSVRKGGDVGHGEDGRVVKALWGGEWTLIVATRGGWVRSWDFAPVVGEFGVGGYGKMRGKANRVGKGRFGGGSGVATPVGGGGGVARVSSTGKVFSSVKAQISHEVKAELFETSMELKREKEEEARRYKLMVKMNGSASPSNFGVVGLGRSMVVGGAPPATSSSASGSGSMTRVSPMGNSLTEREMIEYAMMLSMEEQNDPFSLGDSVAAYGATPTRGRGAMPADIPKSGPILDEGSIFAPISSTPPAASRSLPKLTKDLSKPPPAPSTSSSSSSIPQSPSNPWSTGKSFASVVAAAGGSSPKLSSKSSSVLAFTESRTSPSNPFYARNVPKSRFPIAAWYEDEEWEDEMDFYRPRGLGGGGDLDANMYTPAKRRSSLSLSLSGLLPPPVEDNEAVVGGKEPCEWEGEDLQSSNASVQQSPVQQNGTPKHGSYSSSMEKRKTLLGSSSLESGATLQNMRGRSPRLGPLGSHVSPGMGPMISPSLAPTTRFSNVGVQVAPRATREDEEEELMFVLALSLSEMEQ